MIPLAQVFSAAQTLPLTGSDVALRVLAVLGLITINAFFVTAEFSIVSVRQSRISQLAAAGDVQARTVQSLQRSIERLLSTAQLGITLSSLALGWIGESTIAVLLRDWIGRSPLPLNLQAFVTHSLAVPTAFLIVAYLQIVLGELCPKAVAILYPEQLARFLGPPSLAIARIFNPFIWSLNQSTRFLLRLVGIQYDGQGWYNRVTTEELQLLLQSSNGNSDIEDEERELLSNALEFADVSVREIMVQRIDMIPIAEHATFQTVLNEVAETAHSRYPVVGESLDDIKGVLYFKDLVAPLVKGALTLTSSIQPWVRSAQFVPENLPLSELLQLMQRNRQAMVIVVDEFGGTAGLATLKDLAAEIIGSADELQDPATEPNIQFLDDRTVLVQAQTNLEEVNDLLNLDLPLEESYQTLGGFLINQLQKIPAQGERLQYNNLELTVTAVVGPRLHQIQIEQLLPLNETTEHSPAGPVSPTPERDEAEA